MTHVYISQICPLNNTGAHMCAYAHYHTYTYSNIIFANFVLYINPDHLNLVVMCLNIISLSYFSRNSGIHKYEPFINDDVMQVKVYLNGRDRYSKMADGIRFLK